MITNITVEIGYNLNNLPVLINANNFPTTQLKMFDDIIKNYLS